MNKDTPASQKRLKIIFVALRKGSFGDMRPKSCNWEMINIKHMNVIKDDTKIPKTPITISANRAI
jgi:hypothetical protein